MSVERIFDPSLVGKPVVVGGTRFGGGVVTSASYEARAFGVRSGMSIREASERAPRAVFLPGRHGEYGRFSASARAIVERFSPIVRAASIDEQYIDFSGCESLYRKPEDADDDATIRRVVCEITGAIQAELGLPSSAGIATSKPMAKVASGLAKPQGVLLVPAGHEAATLAPLPVRKLPGIGPVAEAKLHALGIQTLGQVAVAPEHLLAPVFGSRTAHLRAAARGVGTSELGRERPAFREHDPFGDGTGSISNERTFRERSQDETEAILSSLCERVAFRARRRGMKARVVTLKLRYADFETLTRSVAIGATHDDFEIHRVARDLYRRARTRPAPVRLLGVGLSQFVFEGFQLELFDRGARRSIAVDRLREKFGYDTVHLASTPRGRRDPDDPRERGPIEDEDGR